jgi:hypothetical protein
MAGNTLTLEFAGDADKLQRAAKQATAATDDVAESAKDAGAEFKKSGDESGNFTDKIGKLGAGVTGMTDAIDTAGAATQALADIQSASSDKAARLARANNDVEQAQEDLNQAVRDGKQATIDADQAEVDLEQARLDQATALKDYNDAVKKFGAGSAEATQAQIDLKQAGVDVKQAQEDSAQAVRDAAQANIDGKAAQLDLNDAMKEAHPPELQTWADNIGMVTPLLSAMVGVTGLVTAAQWAWNAAQLASPLTWIIVGIGALVAVIVLIATKTTWFQRGWSASWKWIKSAASNTVDFVKKIPGWIGGAFSKIANVITAPFRWAFNFIADAWNNTIGSLSWSVPGWVPGIGGNSIGVPHIPKFHTGGTVPGAPGSEMLAMVQAGETIRPAGAGSVLEIRSGGTQLDDLLVEILSRAVRRRGGNAQLVLGGRNA